MAERPRIKSQRDADAISPCSQRIEVYCDKPAGLGLRVTPAGKRSWFCFYRAGGQFRRYTIGDAEIIKLRDARKEATKVLAEAAKGNDPQGAKKAEREAVKRRRALARAGVDGEWRLSRFIDLYFEDPDVAALRSTVERRRVLEKDLLAVVGDGDIRKIARADIMAARDAKKREGKLVAANRVLSYAQALFRWLAHEDQGFLEADPTAGVKKAAAEADFRRDRALSPDEIEPFWKACEAIGEPAGPLLQFLLLTGARRGEAAGLRWDEIDTEIGAWRLPASRSKNKRAALIPLSTMAFAIIEARPRLNDSPLVFARPDGGEIAGWSSIGRKLKAETGFAEPIRIHDLRRSCNSGLARIGVHKDLRHKILRHAEGVIDETYDVHDYFAERREALQAWANRVGKLVHADT